MDQLQQDLARIFEQVRLVPNAVIEQIHSFDLAEDGKTLVIMADTADGKTMVITVAPGKPLGVSLQ